MPITNDGEMPQKKFYRSRAHCNPLSHNDVFDYPLHPDLMNWKDDHYPNYKKGAIPLHHQKKYNMKEDQLAPNVLDVGCGFGGLTIALSTILPDSLILGIEIRAKVAEYVRLRIAALRKEEQDKINELQGEDQAQAQAQAQQQQQQLYQNCSVLRTNSMKYMSNYFHKHSISKLFFCFPDPHFKKKNHPRRIITEKLLTEYAYLLEPMKGKLYCITDVEDLHHWHLKKCDSHPLFRKLTDDELKDDPCVNAMIMETEEGKKVARAGNAKYYAVYQRLGSECMDVDMRSYESIEDFFDEDEFGVMSA